MKTEEEIKKKKEEIQSIIDNTYQGVPSFCDLKKEYSQVEILKWVLDEKE